jgi:penicillin-binding protein 1A
MAGSRYKAAMTTPLTAGDPLIPQDRKKLPALSPEKPGPEKHGPEKRGPGKRGDKKRRTRTGAFAVRMLGRMTGIVLGLVMLAIVAGAAVGYTAYRQFSANLPTVDGLRNYQPPVMSRVYAGDSRLIGEYATERRIYVPGSAIPDLVKNAFIAAEDQNFYHHAGVDPGAILRAGVEDFLRMGTGRRPIGASTITQQVARDMLLGSDALTLSRKVREALLAIRIEQTLSKDRILELYLNEIYFGMGSYGVAAAAQSYFNTSLDQLTLPQIAFLAALPKAPNNYNPTKYPDAATARRNWVIDRMRDDGFITAAQADAAKAQPVTMVPYKRPEVAPGADWFAEEVRRVLVEHFGPDRVNTDGLTVRTSLNPTLQAYADDALRRGLETYDRAHGGWRGPVVRLGGETAVRQRWTTDLPQVARPAGMPQDWTLAEVIDTTPGEAHLGVIGPDGRPSILPMLLSDSTWARPLANGLMGPTPRRMADIMQPGDVVMTLLAPAGAPGNVTDGKTPARLSDRLLLRQIPAVSGALVSMDPSTGRVLAMSGGWSFQISQFNRATQAQRQPGSSFKPFVYLTALQHNISPSQRFLDGPFVLNMGAEGEWRPGNYEGTFSGPVALAVALEKSLNLVTIRVADRVGMDAVAHNAISFHMVDKMPLVLPAALGAVDTTVLREAGAYSSLDEEGKEVIPTLVDTVQDRDGHVIWRAPGLACEGCDNQDTLPQIDDQRQQIADPQSTFQLLTMMRQVVLHGTGYKAGIGLDRDIAGKTGTTQDFHDAWFAGFTPQLVTVVWMGFDNPQSLGDNETGGDLAAPIWHDYMAKALDGLPKLHFPMPDGVTMATWDSGSGSMTTAFKTGQTPGASSATVDSSEAAAAGGGGAPGVDTNLGGLY